MSGSVVRVSPMPKLSWPTRPMTSPGYASSSVSRSLPKSLCELDRRTFFFEREWCTVMSRSNLPEQTRMKATRSRCFGSMFAWILKMNPENPGCSGEISTPAITRGLGGGECFRNPSSRSCTPKLLTALPKKTGVFEHFQFFHRPVKRGLVETGADDLIVQRADLHRRAELAAHGALEQVHLPCLPVEHRSEEHTSELQSPYVISYA